LYSKNNWKKKPQRSHTVSHSKKEEEDYFLNNQQIPPHSLIARAGINLSFIPLISDYSFIFAHIDLKIWELRGIKRRAKDTDIQRKLLTKSSKD